MSESRFPIFDCPIGITPDSTGLWPDFRKVGKSLYALLNKFVQCKMAIKMAVACLFALVVTITIFIVHYCPFLCGALGVQQF